MVLKNPDYSIAYLQQGWSIKMQHISHSAFKNNVVSNFNHSFMWEALVQQFKFDATQAARQAISQLGLNGSAE
jgi:hypothetical protein